MQNHLLHYSNDPHSSLLTIVTNHHHSVYEKIESDDSLDIAPTQLHLRSRSSVPSSSEIICKLNECLLQNRKNEFYDEYCPSKEHLHRLKRMIALYPELDVPRDKWQSHPQWSSNRQMTSYHVPIRSTLQKCLHEIRESIDPLQRQDNYNHPQNMTCHIEHIQKARHYFIMSVMMLNMHANNEERYSFPVLMHHFPKIHLYDMYDTHNAIKEQSETIIYCFDAYLNIFANHNKIKNQLCYVDFFWSLVHSLLEWDNLLNQHLHEEEDVVVPMSLIAPTILQHAFDYQYKNDTALQFNNYMSQWSSDPQSVFLQSKL